MAGQSADSPGRAVRTSWHRLVEVWTAQPPVFRALLSVWVLFMISLPIIGWTLGEEAQQRAIPAGVLLQAAAVVSVLWINWGPRRTLISAGLVAVLTWGAEALGSATGFPFGAYDYTGKLQPQLAGVPLIIPLAWLMMLPPAWAVGARLAGSWRSAGFVAAGAAALTAWDLFLDPQMVGWGLWVWENPHGYFGIPWVNYLGWLLTAAVITAVVRPAPLPEGPLVLIYAITCALQTIGLGVFWGLPGPALVGLAVMGSLTVVAVLRGRGAA